MTIIYSGTPIVEIFSPFVKLPSQIDFAKDMSEHVAFENLPNYTGKWEEMRGLLKRIRSVGQEGHGIDCLFNTVKKFKGFNYLPKYLPFNSAAPCFTPFCSCFFTIDRRKKRMFVKFFKSAMRFHFCPFSGNGKRSLRKRTLVRRRRLISMRTMLLRLTALPHDSIIRTLTTTITHQFLQEISEQN